jgi:nitroreductase
MEFWQVIDSRHSIRDFRPDPVPRELIERMLHAAAAAPSAMNAQPWEYHVAVGHAREQVGQIVAEATIHLEEYVEHLGPRGSEGYQRAVDWYESLGNAPVVLGVAMLEPDSDADAVNKLLSVGASVENLMLAATAEGLGACNITFTSWVKDELAEFFNVGEGRSIVALIALGYPSDTPPLAPEHREDIADWFE